MTATAMPTRVVRHPILGFFSGLLLGLGIALLLISFAVIALGTLTPVVVTVAGAILGLVLAFVVPARGGSAAPEVAPSTRTAAVNEPVPSSDPATAPDPATYPAPVEPGDASDE